MKRVAVLRGGPSEEYSVSMQTGSKVLGALQKLNYPHKDIIITKQGEWLESGLLRQPQATLQAVDVVFVALHGTYGEDGQVQRIFERDNIPFTGSRALTSAIAFNKDLTKSTLRAHDICMPRHRKLTQVDLATLDAEIPFIFSEVGKELFVKPLASGSSHGARYVPHEKALRLAITELLEQYDQILVEQYIRGREATVGVLDNFRDTELYTLPVIEIIPPDGEPAFSLKNKYNGSATEIVPGRFSYSEKTKLAEIAQTVHKVIGCQQYSRSDFIVRDGEIYFLEVNTLPGLTDESLFPKAASAVGLEYNQLIEHLIETATV